MSLFDTSIGRVGIAWAGSAVTSVQLPECDDAATLRAMANAVRTPVRHCSTDSPVPPPIRRAIDAITSLLAGHQTDLNFVEIELPPSRSTPFERRVYDATRTIAPGESLTYGEVASLVGEPGAAQAVGQALGANLIPLIIPCHRVLGAQGHLVGFSANGGVDTKRRLLLIERCAGVAPSLFD